MIQGQLVLDYVHTFFKNQTTLHSSTKLQNQLDDFWGLHNQVVLSRHKKSVLKEIHLGNKSDSIVYINSSFKKSEINSLFNKNSDLNIGQQSKDGSFEKEDEQVDWQKSNAQIFRNIQIRHQQDLQKQEYNQTCQFFQLLRKSSMMDIQISDQKIESHSGVLPKKTLEQVLKIETDNVIKIEILRLNNKYQFNQKHKGSQIQILKQHNLSEITNEANLNLIEHRFKNDSNLSPFVDRQFIDCIDQQERVYKKQKISNICQFPFFLATEYSLLNSISQQGLEQVDCQNQNDDVIVGRINLEFDKKKYQQLDKMYHLYVEKGKQMLGVTIQNKNMYQHIFSSKSQQKMRKQEVLKLRMIDNQIKVQCLDECLVQLHQNCRFLLEKGQLVMLDERIGFKVTQILNCNDSLENYSDKSQDMKPKIRIVVIRRHAQNQIYEEIDKIDIVYGCQQEQTQHKQKQMILEIIQYDQQKQVWLVQQTGSSEIINHTSDRFEKEWLEKGINTKESYEQNQGVFIALPKYQLIDLGHSNMICGEQQFRIGQLLI